MKGLVIAGPTGVGKTDLSLRLAEKLKTEIISAQPDITKKKRA